MDQQKFALKISMYKIIQLKIKFICYLLVVVDVVVARIIRRKCVY